MSPANARGQPDPQLASAPQSATLAAPRGRGHVKAVQMADEFGVTHEAIRKDLMLLESHRLLRRHRMQPKPQSRAPWSSQRV
jgi:DeoR family transcriptional regulator, fructose operon transcriptional repressor